jgi:putative transposase
MRNAQHSLVAATIRTVFAHDTAQAAAQAWRDVAGQLRPRFRDLAALMDQAETDVLAFMAFRRS